MGDRRKGAGLLWEVEMDFPLMEREERAEGGGFLGKLGMSHQETGDWRVERIWRRVMLGTHRAVVPQQWKTADAAARGTRQDTAKGHCHPRASSAKSRGFHTLLDEGPETP